VLFFAHGSRARIESTRTSAVANDYGSVSATGNRAGGFLGAVGVSFLTAV
jgi:hypothetical protein